MSPKLHTPSRRLTFTLVLSAAAVVTSASILGCTGDDNSLPLPPADASADAKSDGASKDATTRPDAEQDAAEEGGDSSVSERDSGDSAAADAPSDAAVPSEASPDASVDAAPSDADANPADAEGAG
jgi:hypothetical protein